MGGATGSRSKERLSARFVATIKEPGYYADGGGLYLQVSKVGSKSWIFRYTLHKPREMGLGAFAVVPLKMARERAGEARELVANSIDPIDHRDTKRSQDAANVAGRKTFHECADACIAALEAEWRNAKHAAQWRSTMSEYVYPIIGDVAVRDVGVDHVMSILEPIWRVKTETASRVRGRIERVLSWAAARGYRSKENPAQWRGHLDQLLARPTKVKKPKHHEAVPFDGVNAFIEQLGTQDGIAAAALEFLILTATRANEAVRAKWSEIDLQRAIWIIPATRMKADREHRVPLSSKAVAVLKRMQPLPSEAGYVFPSPIKSGQPVTDAALLATVKGIAGDTCTTHGFRSTFRDWAAECTVFPNIVAEAALAHVVADKTEAAYRRGDLLEKRREMMDAWAQFCCGPRAKVIDLPKHSQRRANTA